MRIPESFAGGWRAFGLLLSLIALWTALILAPAAWGVDLSEYEFEWDEGIHKEEWYDPTDWFDTGEGLSFETDWYNETYGYSDPYDYLEEMEAQGYFETEVKGGDYDFGLGYDYYTRDWYDNQGTFAQWYE